MVSTISMAIFDRFLFVYQAGYLILLVSPCNGLSDQLLAEKLLHPRNTLELCPNTPSEAESI